MGSRAFDTNPTPPVADALPASRRWYCTLGLIALTVVLLTFAFAPFGQFYLAWVGLVPWLLVVGDARSQWKVFAWSWLAGTIFFTVNMWWLVFVTGPGMVALMMILGLYWGGAALVIRGAGLLRASNDSCHAEPSMAGRCRAFCRAGNLLPILLVAIIWVAFEWLRGCFPFNGLPWLFVGHAQTPVLALCQIADFTGVFGISFLAALVNAWIAMLIVRRFHVRRLLGSAVVIVILIGASVAYGVFRIRQTVPTPGPRVLVIQPNYPQSNSGAKGATTEEIVKFHVDTTERALQSAGPVDLVVWSETMMPELNREYRLLAQGALVERTHAPKIPDYGAFLDEIHGQLETLCRTHHVALLTGAIYCDMPRRGVIDRRNSAYFFTSDGAEDAAHRYDKIHLVPWGEYIPFKETIPPLYRLFAYLSPYGDDSYTLTAGAEDARTVFPLRVGSNTYRFVTPICFEDIDASLVAGMFRGESGAKRADFIVNITNDGWFRANEMPQHLQAARFRSIENRAPTARSVNTGISGFIDSTGAIDRSRLVPAGEEGWRVATLGLDPRVTLYTRFGDAFAVACALLTLFVAAGATWGWWRRRADMR